MTTAKLLQRFYKTEYSFLVNVIVNHHSNPYKKLKGLANLVDAGHWAALPTDLDHLVIDGVSAPWSRLEDWSKKICNTCHKHPVTEKNNVDGMCNGCQRKYAPCGSPS